MTSWKKCDFSRSEIDRAGAIIRSPYDSARHSEFVAAYRVMDSWRSSHAFPLNTIQMTLRRRSWVIDPRSVIVQRLKRAPSVTSKLRRYDGMQLSRMQDLGGCRAIFSEVSYVYDVRQKYMNSRQRHELATEKDYISEPQASGYRGIHLIYKYVSDRSDAYNGHRIEVQLRTKIQHAWATAVEIAGVYVRTSLKSSIGPKEWLDFFRYASSAFADIEGTSRLHDEISPAEVRNLLREADIRIDARNKLRTFAAAHEYISNSSRGSDTHFILILDISEQKTYIEAFRNIAEAAARYADLEGEYIENDLVDVVLVAAENVESASKAYPNYFVDTTDFLNLLDQIIVA